MTSHYGGIYWDNNKRIYEISGGSIQVKDSIYFKDSSRVFNGSYDTLTNKPATTQGTDGSQGTKGDTGTSGSTGSQGTKGDTGTSGSTGSQGTKGDTGNTGSAGSNGSNGSNGSQGATGTQGTKGDTGNTGSAGSNGSNGSQGATGTQGADGGGGGGGGVIDLINGGKSIGNLTSITYDGMETLTFASDKGSFSVMVQPAEFGGR